MSGNDGSTVNPQVTDAVAETKADVLENAPAIVMGNLYQSIAQATAIGMENAVATQQAINAAINAATTAAVDQILSVNSAATAVGVSELLSTGHETVVDHLKECPIDKP